MAKLNGLCKLWSACSPSTRWQTWSLSCTFGLPKLPHIRSFLLSSTDAHEQMPSQQGSGSASAPCAIGCGCSSVVTQQTTTPKAVLRPRPQASATSQTRWWIIVQTTQSAKESSCHSTLPTTSVILDINWTRRPSSQSATPAIISAKHQYRI